MRTFLSFLFLLTIVIEVPLIAQSTKLKWSTIPEREIPAAKTRGESYAVPATNWEKRPVVWGWSCEGEDGSGFSFGGVDQTSNDGSPHTRIKANGEWKTITDDLRKKNILQPFCNKAFELKNACKDALAVERNIFFEGKTPADEEAAIKKEVSPLMDKLLKDMNTLEAELKSQTKLEKYEAGQIQYALGRISAAKVLIKPVGIKITEEHMTNMRSAQILLDLAAESLDAEPPSRALSLPAYESKTKSFVIFGGDHMDYLTNDLWVFDIISQRWFQRFQETAPEIRGDHHFEGIGEGKIRMYGGYSLNHNEGYKHIGPAQWIYDITKNSWTPEGHTEKTFPSDTRSARYMMPVGPEAFMKCPQPDAKSNEVKLKSIPENTWTRLATPINAVGRDWGTWGFDFDRDMLYLWAGGHASYAGNDVARYHIKSDRWEITDVVEIPLGCCGTNEQYPSGVNFNKRPWVKKHVWNSLAYNPDLKKLMQVGVNDGTIDRYFYLYDPDKSEWSSRHAVPENFKNDAGGVQIRHTPHGMLSWYGEEVWLFNSKKFEWEKVALKSKVPSTAVDSCGLVYDPKRDRMLFFTQGGYGRPFSGRVDALDLKTFQVEQLNPEGQMPDISLNWVLFLREVAYDAKNDLFLFPQVLNMGNKILADRFPAYDPVKNRWVTIKLESNAGGNFSTPYSRWNHWVCSSIGYDAKRELFWLGDGTTVGGVWAMRLNLSKTEIVPLKDHIQQINKKD